MTTSIYPGSLYGAPYAPPASEIPAFRGGRHVFYGHNGTTWDLTNPDEGVYFPDAAIVGLHMPEFDRYVTDSPGVSGTTYQGSRTKERICELNVMIYVDEDESSEAWEARMDAFWDMWHPEQVNIWEFTSPSGRKRRLAVRYSGGDHGYDRDAHEDGWALYQFEVVAEDPYWKGEEKSQVFGSPPQYDFFDPPDTGDMFYISGAATLATASMTNEGDVGGHVMYTITGPLSDILISTADGELGPPDVPDGSTLIMVTDPRDQWATLDGVYVDGLVDPWDPQPLPRGADVPITIAATGTGTVRATFVSRYFRAFGRGR